MSAILTLPAGMQPTRAAPLIAQHQAEQFARALPAVVLQPAGDLVILRLATQGRMPPALQARVQAELARGAVRRDVYTARQDRQGGHPLELEVSARHATARLRPEAAQLVAETLLQLLRRLV